MHAMFPTRNKSIRKAKISESALVEKLTDSLNSFIEKNPPIAKSEDASHANVDKKQASQVTASQNATKNFLAGKTLLKNIAKACTKENITLGDDNESNIFVESLVDNYKTNYPLSARSLIDALKKTAGNSIETSKNLDVSLPSVIDKVDALMEEYQTRIRLLKRRREEDATKPTEVEEPKPKKARGPNEDRKSAIVEKKDKRGRKTHFNPDTPEGEVLTKILEKYSKERESNSRVEIARLQEIVDEVKAEGGYDWFDMPKEKLSRKVRRRYLANPEASSRQKDILDDMYGRYVKAKEDSGSKISKGKLESIFEEVKQERGGKFDMKTRLQNRYSKDFPDTNGKTGQNMIAKLSPDAKKRRQLLFNEITSRYAQFKEGKPKKSKDDVLSRIIQETKGKKQRDKLETEGQTLLNF